ncbi:uracil-DNA glycosylase [candidate division KSB1 bacterium]
MILQFDFISKKTRFTDFCDMVKHCTLCPRLYDRPKVMSNNNGNIQSKILFVAEAPGRLGADRTGIPLYGDKTGDNFESLLGNIGWNRKDVFITNALLCNPREDNGNNSTPTLEEIGNCSSFLEMTIELIQPEVVVSLGIIALKALNNLIPHGLSLKDNVGKPTPWYDRLLVPLYHPGPRAMIHRSLSNQRSDFISLVKIVHPLKGIIKKQNSLLSKSIELKESDFKPIHHIVYTIVQELGKMTYFKLTKLLYLVDLLALERLGSTISGEIYLRQVEGPWPPSLRQSIPLLADHEIIFESKRRIPLVSLGPNPRFKPDIGEDAENILAEVLCKYAQHTNSQIKTAVYRTKPMKYILNEEKKGRDMRKIPVIYQNNTSIQLDKT